MSSMPAATERESERRDRADFGQFLSPSGAIADSKRLTVLIPSPLALNDIDGDEDIGKVLMDYRRRYPYPCLGQDRIISQYALSSATHHIGVVELRENNYENKT